MKKSVINLFKIAIIFILFLTTVILCAPTKVSAAESLTYKTNNSIVHQGDNNMYYAWGTPENYVLMNYGLGYSGTDIFHGVEGYAHISGSSIHPGNVWGVMIIWVSPADGNVRLNGRMEKGVRQGDGVTLGVYKQNYGGELETLFEKFVGVNDELVYPMDKTFDVKKGDSFIFYCDSGKANENSCDSCGCPFEITLTTNETVDKNQDLSQYLNAGPACEVGGFKNIENSFTAEILDGTLTEKITTTTTGCAGSVITSIFGLLALAGGVVVLRKKREE